MWHNRHTEYNVYPLFHCTFSVRPATNARVGCFVQQRPCHRSMTCYDDDNDDVDDDVVDDDDEVK